MANEAMMAQQMRGADYQAPQGGYFGPMPQYGLGAYGQPRQTTPDQGVISPEMLREAMNPPEAQQQAQAAPPQPQQPQQPGAAMGGLDQQTLDRIRQQLMRGGMGNMGNIREY